MLSTQPPGQWIPGPVSPVFKRLWWENSKDGDCLEELFLDGMILLNLILYKWGVNCGFVLLPRHGNQWQFLMYSVMKLLVS